MLVMRFLTAILLALSAQIAPAQAQTATEIVLQLDGQAVLDNEIEVARRKIAPVRQGFDPDPVKVEGNRLSWRGTATADLSSYLSKLRDTLEGYDVRLASGGMIEAVLTDAALAKRLVAAGEAAERTARSRLEKAAFTGASVERRNVTQLAVTLPPGQSHEDATSLLIKPGILTINVIVHPIDATKFELFKPKGGLVALPNDSTGDVQVVRTDHVLTNDAITSARAARDLYGRPAVNFTLTAAGAQTFGRATTEMVGNALAIVVDGRIVSAPVIHAAITEGEGQIIGAFTYAEAERLAAILASPPMPARLVVVESGAVDPPR